MKKASPTILTIILAGALICPLPGPASAAWTWSQVKAYMQKGNTPQELLASWPESSQILTRKIIEEFGPPDEATVRVFLWHGRGPWKRIVVYRKGVLEQAIAFNVSADKRRDVEGVASGLRVHRASGELSARSRSQAENFLALNLAHDVAANLKNSEEARQFYVRVIELMSAGKSSPYTAGLLFKP